MGALNTYPTFVAINIKLQIEWDTLAKERGFKIVASKIIVDYVLLYGCTAGKILAYFRTIMGVIKHLQAKLKLKRCKLFQDRWYFVGMDVASSGKKPEQSKNEAYAKLERPNKWGYLSMLIGIFGFYTQLLTLYELEIRT